MAAVLLLALGVATWFVRSFDAERLKRHAIDWMQANHGRELAIDGPVTLHLWPQPGVTVQRLRLSERGRPQERFASVDEAVLTLRIEPLLARREIEIGRVVAKGLQVTLRRDADGRRNVDDLLVRAAGGKPRASSPAAIESIELADVELQVSDALTGVEGRLAVQHLGLDHVGPGLRSPLHLQAQAGSTDPVLSAAVKLDAELELLPAPQPGAPPIVRLHQADLRLHGQGFGVEALDARLQAESIGLDYGAAPGIGDSRVDLDGVQLQFSGKQLGWRVDAGRLGLARLRLDVLGRKLELEQLALEIKGRRQGTTLDAQLSWPALEVVGDSLQGGPMTGRLALGGDRQLSLQLSSQAPGGVFERITVPALHVEVDGRVGPRTVRGHAEAALVLEPRPFAAALDRLSLALRLSDPALPPIQVVVMDGNARLSARAGSGSVNGTINDQRFDARVDAVLGQARPVVDLDANFATLDLDRFIAPADRDVAPPPNAAATPVDLQPLQWADGRLRLKVARLVRPPYRVDGLDVDAGIDNGVLDLRRLAGRAWGGTFAASGSADAGSGQVGLRLNATDVDLRALLADTVGYDGLHGRGQLDADLRSRGATVGALRSALGGRAALALRPAAIRGIDLAQTLRSRRTASSSQSDAVASAVDRQTAFSQLDASFEIRDGVARGTDLDGRSEFLRVTGEGSIDLAQGRLDYLLRARVVDTAGGRAGPEMVMLNGVTVPVEVHGPFGELEWQVRWAAVTAAVAAYSVPNAVRGTVGGVLRGAAGAVRGIQDAAPRPPPQR